MRLTLLQACLLDHPTPKRYAQTMNWPPDYTLKISPRARHVGFRITVKNGLIVTIPKRFNQAELPAIMQSKRRWIEKHLVSIIEIHAERAKINRPDNITLTAINKTWNVVYMPNTNKNARLRELDNNILMVFGVDLSDEICFKLLKRWLKAQAKQHLMSKLLDVAGEMQLDFSKLTIRDQQTRWGSCSSQKTISLNYKLILLPFELMRYVLIHEMAHTVHLNHSRRFWGLVSKFDSDYKKHDKRLTKGEEFLPSWVVL